MQNEDHLQCNTCLCKISSCQIRIAWSFCHFWQVTIWGVLRWSPIPLSQSSAGWALIFTFHSLRVESRCCSRFPQRNLIWDDSSWRWMIWTGDEACCIVPLPADSGAQQAARLGRSTDGFPKSAAAEAIKWSAGAKCFSYWCWGVALGSVISACCCLGPLNFISGCTAHVSTCWRAHNECEW